MKNIFELFQKFSENPNTSKDFSKCLKTIRSSEKHFWTFFEVFRKVCVYGKYKWHMTYSTVYHSKALHN